MIIRRLRDKTNGLSFGKMSDRIADEQKMQGHGL